MLLERELLSELVEHLEARQATVITGIRRSGKTTLCKMLLDKIESQNKIYLDIESFKNRQLFEDQNYDNIILHLQNEFPIDISKKLYLVLDEIQFLKNLPSVIKYLYDHYDIKFILTGSSSYYMKNLFSESLSGRKSIFELYTLTFKEFLKFRNIYVKESELTDLSFDKITYMSIQEYYKEYIKYGGFPEVVLESKEKIKKRILDDILDSYIKTDIKSFINFDDYNVILKLFKVLSSRVCNKLEVTNIAKAIGVSPPTVSNYLELLEGTYLFKRIPVMTKNPEREISKMPKLYIHDNGLLNSLAEVSSGVQFENSIFNQLKHFGELNYYQLKTGREIDFIINSKTAFEVKEYCGDFDVKRLKRLSGNLGINETKMIFRYPPPDNKLQSNEYIWGGDIR